MISAVQHTRVDGPSQLSRAQPSIPRGAEPREASRGSTPSPTFQEARGSTVAGGTLIAAQLAASEDSRGSQQAGTDPKQSTTTGTELTEQEREQVREMQARDREVRTHEQAHKAAGGQYASAPEYDLERGPDGKSYAVSGRVSISTSPVPGDPEATIAKMDVVKRAALAPVEPSSADRSVAADAESKRADARSELNSIRAEERQAALEETLGKTEEADAPFRSDDGKDGEALPDAGKTRNAESLPGLGPVGQSGQDDEGAQRQSDDEDERAVGDALSRSDRRDEEGVSRDFAAFLALSGAERTQAQLQPGLASPSQGLDIRL